MKDEKELKIKSMFLRVTTKEKTIITKYARQKKVSISRLLVESTIKYINRYPIKDNKRGKK